MDKEFRILISKIKKYNREEVEYVTKAYEFAKKCHEGQKRISGEPYIIHPITVTYILANMHADRDTLCAGLLHDVIEDCGVTKEQIADLFNPTIAELVDGVTNLSKVDFQNKSERLYGTKRKIILGIMKDARAVIIKLADRLHNMSTLQYQTPDKRKEKAEETLTFYAPLARYIGAEKLRRELEDLAFLYLNPDAYFETKDKLDRYVNSKNEYVHQMMENIKRELDDHRISSILESRIKNLYAVYLKFHSGEYIENIHDLLAIKVLTRNIKDCYYSLGLVHQLYNPCNPTFKDYICKPKDNMYASLHSTVVGLDDILVQMQIRTREMEKINMFGLTAYWDICKGQAGDKMHEILRDKYKFNQSIKRLNNLITDSKYFVTNVERNILGENISVYGYDGYLVTLPEGATVIDFAYHYGKEFAEKMVGAFVNGSVVDLGSKLHNGDRVHIIISEDKLGPNPSWLSDANDFETQKIIRKSLNK